MITCDFDTDMCGWSKDLDKNWIWDHGIGRVENSKVMPSRIVYAPKAQDVSNGMFMYTDFTSMDPGNAGEMIMMSEFVPATSASCLSFYYLPYVVDSANTYFKVILRDVSG